MVCFRVEHIRKEKWIAGGTLRGELTWQTTILESVGPERYGDAKHGPALKGRGGGGQEWRVESGGTYVVRALGKDWQLDAWKRGGGGMEMWEK